MNIDLTVWQFVRLMVWFEDNPPKGKTPEDSALLCWQDVWQTLDKELERLGASDPEAYADMMMDQNVVLADANRRHRRQIAAAFTGVIAQMNETLGTKTSARRQKDATDELDDLAFEQASLSQLVKKL